MIDEGIATLRKLNELIDAKKMMPPAFKMVLTATGEFAYRRPEEIHKVRKAHKGWDGPYVNHIVNDPWGRPYVYETRPEGGHPILYSRGPDGRMGTTDDVMPDQLSFEAAFRDTSWTNHWAPCELRGIVVAPDEETRTRVQNEMKKYD